MEAMDTSEDYGPMVSIIWGKLTDLGISSGSCKSSGDLGRMITEGSDSYYEMLSVLCDEINVLSFQLGLSFFCLNDKVLWAQSLHSFLLNFGDEFLWELDDVLHTFDSRVYLADFLSSRLQLVRMEVCEGTMLPPSLSSMAKETKKVEQEEQLSFSLAILLCRVADHVHAHVDISSRDQCSLPTLASQLQHHLTNAASVATTTSPLSREQRNFLLQQISSSSSSSSVQRASDEMCHHYALRRVAMRQRANVTVKCLSWSNRLTQNGADKKKNGVAGKKEQLVEEAKESEDKKLKPSLSNSGGQRISDENGQRISVLDQRRHVFDDAVSWWTSQSSLSQVFDVNSVVARHAYDALLIPRSLLRVTKVSSRTSQRGAESIARGYVLEGVLPDRGGRVGETRGTKMPSFKKREEAAAAEENSAKKKKEGGGYVHARGGGGGGGGVHNHGGNGGGGGGGKKKRSGGARVKGAWSEEKKRSLSASSDGQAPGGAGGGAPTASPKKGNFGGKKK